MPAAGPLFPGVGVGHRVWLRKGVNVMREKGGLKFKNERRN